MSTQKRCLYEVLGLSEICTQDEIRAAYKKLALQRHPDKLIRSGISVEDATASFQELVNAYEVLSDPKERKWYDSHRSQILFSNPSDTNSSVPDLFSYFSTSCYTDYTHPKTGFYTVYGDLFNKIYANEIKFVKTMGQSTGIVKEAPLMGDIKSPNAQVNAFYGYWLGFSTVMDFMWVDNYDAEAGINRKVRRLMEEENKKLRKKAKREFNETVRRLAEFVKKRDKRMVDMMKSKEKEKEKKRAEELERKKKMEQEKLERARSYEDPEWAKIDEQEVDRFEEISDSGKEEERKELYCVVCGKKFRSEKQWKNHEQSKKHKEKVVQLRETFVVEDDFLGVDETGDDVFKEGDGNASKEDRKAGDANDTDVGCETFVSADELVEKFSDSFGLEDECGPREGPEIVEDSNEAESDDEASTLEALMSVHKVTQHVSSKNQSKASTSNSNGNNSTEDLEFMKSNNLKGCKKDSRTKREKGRKGSTRARDDDDDDVTFPCEDAKLQGFSDITRDHIDDEANNEEFMTYTNRKGSRKSRRAKKSHNFDGEATRASDGDANVPSEEHSVANFSDMTTFILDDEATPDAARSDSSGHQAAGKKGAYKRDADTKAKNSAKGRKQKAKARNFALTCENCGEEFESRNRLHKHLGETGHASLKSR